MQSIFKLINEHWNIAKLCAAYTDAQSITLRTRCLYLSDLDQKQNLHGKYPNSPSLPITSYYRMRINFAGVKRITTDVVNGEENFGRSNGRSVVVSLYL